MISLFKKFTSNFNTVIKLSFAIQFEALSRHTLSTVMNKTIAAIKHDNCHTATGATTVYSVLQHPFTNLQFIWIQIVNYSLINFTFFFCVFTRRSFIKRFQLY